MPGFIRSSIAICALTIACCIATCCAACAVALPAFAEEVQEGNEINVQQAPDSSFLYDTDIYDLKNADSTFEEKTVQITGEVVGDLIMSDEDPQRRWITLASLDKSKEGTITMSVTADQASIIDTFGRYGQKGTTLRVKGTFHLSCPEHEGVSDVHAETMSVVEKGKVDRQVFDVNNFVPGIVALCLGLALMILFRILRERQR